MDAKRLKPHPGHHRCESTRSPMKKIEAVIKTHRLLAVEEALEAAGFRIFAAENVILYGREGRWRGGPLEGKPQPRFKIELVVRDDMVRQAVSAIAGAAFFGHPDDGDVSVFPVNETVSFWSLANRRIGAETG